MILTFFSQDFDAWFNTNSLVEEKQLVERLHSVSTRRLSGCSLEVPGSCLWLKLATDMKL